MSAKFKKGLARSHTLSDISDFTSSQASSIPCGGLLCDSLDFVRMSGSRNSGGCSSLLSKMNIGREVSSDYDLDETNGPTEEADVPTNNQVMKKSKFSHFKPSTFTNSNGDDHLEEAASPVIKGSKVFSPNISKRAYSPYKNGGKLLGESSALYNSCQIDSSCSRSLRIAKENRKALGMATSTDDASLSDEHSGKILLNEYTPATVSRLNSINYKLSQANRAIQYKNLSKYIKQKLRIVNREPTTAITLPNESNSSNQNWISMPHGGTGSSILYSHTHYLSMYRMDVDQFQLKSSALSSDDTITYVLPLDSHFPHVLLVSTLSGKLQLYKYQQHSRDYQLKLSLQPLDVDSQTYPTSLAQYKSTFYIGCSDGSLTVFDFKTRKVMFSIQGEIKPKPYIPNGTELSPKIVGQKNSKDEEDNFKENTSEFKFEMEMKEYSSNSLDQAFTSGKKQVVDSPNYNRESSDLMKEMIPQELGVKGIVVRDEMLAYWTLQKIKVISRLDPENIVYESELNDLIQCNFSLQSNKSLIILTEKTLDIVYLPTKKIIFQKKADETSNCCEFKGFAINTLTKEIALLSNNTLKQTSAIEIMSFISEHLRSIDQIKANCVFNTIHFDHTKQLLFATTETQLKAFQFFNKQTQISLQSQLLQSVHQTGQDIPSFESNQAGHQTHADPSNQTGKEDFITISNF